MISKNTVQSEELKGQLAERLPGAYSLAAKAMGITTQELSKQLEQGKVLAKDLLPKLSKELDKMTDNFDATNSTIFQFTRLSNQMTRFKTKVFASGFGEALKVLASGFADTLENAMPLAEFLGKTLKAAILTITLPIQLLIAGITDLSRLFAKMVPDRFKKGLSEILPLVVGIVAGLKTLKTTYRDYRGSCRSWW